MSEEVRPEALCPEEPVIRAYPVNGERPTAGLDLTANNFAVIAYAGWQDMGMPLLYGGKSRVSVGLS